jgi:hypothetical protein
MQMKEVGMLGKKNVERLICTASVNAVKRTGG